MPLTPMGKGSMYQSVPVNIGGRAMFITFRPDAEEAKKFLPPPLVLRDSVGICKFYELVRSPSVEEDLTATNPERTQYSEGIVALATTFHGEPGQYNVVNWVTQEEALIRGREVYGMPKKLAKVTMSRFLPGQQVGQGTVIKSIVERHSCNVITASLKLERKIDPRELPSFGVFYLLRVIPSPDPSVPDIKQLLKLAVNSVQISDVWQGQASLEFHDSQNEEIEAVKPLEVTSGYYFSIRWILPTIAKIIQLYD